MYSQYVNWKKSIFTRLVAMFLLIISPLYVIILILYNWGTGTVRGEIVDFSRLQIAGKLLDLERETQSITQQLESLITDRYWMELYSHPNALSDYDWNFEVSYLQNRLRNINSGSSIIKSIKIHIPAMQRVISDTELIEKFNEERYMDLYNKTPGIGSNITVFNDQLTIIFVYPLYSGSRNRLPLFIAETTLSSIDIMKSLNVNSSQENYKYVLFSQRGSYVNTDIKDEETLEWINMIVTDDFSLLSGFQQRIEVGNGVQFVLAETSNSLNLGIIALINESELFKSIHNFRVWILVFSIAAAVVIIAYLALANSFIRMPMSQLLFHIKQMKQGKMDARIHYSRDDEFNFLFSEFNEMVERLNELIEQVYKQKILTQKAELKHLQSQINPHFLYNSFFILYNMVVIEDVENLEKMTLQLGSYFQYITRSAEDEVPFKKEVAHAKIYTDIQGLRFKNRIQIDFDELPSELEDIMVPKLILQPIIENAFEHGFIDTMSEGILKVSFNQNEERITITVENNGSHVDSNQIAELKEKLSSDDEHMESTGIVNINKRLKLKYGEKFGVFISLKECNFFCVSITIPGKKYYKAGG